MVGSRSAWHPLGPPVLSRKATFQLVGTQHILVHGVVPLQMQSFALPLHCWTWY